MSLFTRYSILTIVLFVSPFLFYSLNAANTATSYTNIIFSEVVYDTTGPNAGGNENNTKEWIELFNPTGETIDITGWKIYDSDNQHFIFPATTTIGAGETLLLVNDTLSFQEDFPSVNPNIDMDGDGCYFQHRCIALANGSDALFLVDESNTIIDDIEWEGEFEADEGNSICRTDDGWQSDCTPSPGTNPDLSFTEPTPIPTPVPTPVTIPESPVIIIISTGEEEDNSDSHQGSGGQNKIIVENLRKKSHVIHSTIGEVKEDEDEKQKEEENEVIEKIDIINTDNFKTIGSTCEATRYNRYPEQRGTLTDEQAVNQYSDITTSHPFFSALVDLTEQEVVSGEGINDNANLDEFISRAEVTKIMTIAREDTLRCTWEETFIDVQESQWFFPFVMNIDHNNIIHGRSEDYYHPDETINLSEMYKILSLSFQLDGYNEVRGDQDWYQKYYTTLITKNLLPSWAVDEDPNKLLTRGEVFDIVSYALLRLDGVQ